MTPVKREPSEWAGSHDLVDRIEFRRGKPRTLPHPAPRQARQLTLFRPRYEPKALIGPPAGIRAICFGLRV